MNTTDEAAREHISVGIAMGATMRITARPRITEEIKRDVAKHLMDRFGIVDRAEAFEFVPGELTVLLMARHLTGRQPRERAIELLLSRATQGIEEQFPAIDDFSLVLLDEKWMVTL